MNARALVVSIHDVSPLTREAVERMLEELGKAGVGRTSLLVVPDHHRQGAIGKDTGFCGWLREAVTAGHEAVLHGYAHVRERKAGESAITRLVTGCYTAGEGEYFDIGYEEARTLLERGRKEVAECAGGVTPEGFIAPAWLLSADGERAAKDAGFLYTTRLKRVVHLPTGEGHESQSLCWSVRSGWRRAVSLRWNAFLFNRLAENPLMRISVHPPDMAHEEVWEQVKRLCGAAAKDREPITFAKFAKLRFDYRK